MKKYNSIIITMLIMAIVIFTSSCSEEDDDTNKIEYGSFTDTRDGVAYKTVKIGDQVWLAENLRYLPFVVKPDSGSKDLPLYYVLAYEGNNLAEAKNSPHFATYGALYNWAAAKKACPKGWHLPTDDEWMKLASFVGGLSVAGDKLKESGNAHWGVVDDLITDEFGFTALPGGCCLANGLYNGLEDFGLWWTGIEVDSTKATSMLINENGTGLYIGTSSKKHGYSIRCVKD